MGEVRGDRQGDRREPGLPEPGQRWRCAGCGNLTRFDVTVTRRTRAFHHYTVGGDLTVEDEEILSEVVEDVACRWCGTGKGVEPLPEKYHVLSGPKKRERSARTVTSSL